MCACLAVVSLEFALIALRLALDTLARKSVRATNKVGYDFHEG